MSSSKPVIYVAHARLAIRERNLDRIWIEQTAGWNPIHCEPAQNAGSERYRNETVAFFVSP